MADFLRAVEMNDLVQAVRDLSRRKKYRHRISWTLVWSDEVREWFAEKRLDTGERATHPTEDLTWNGHYWQTADNAACEQGLLHKWKKPNRQVGWSLPDDYEEAKERAEAEEFDQVK